MALLKFALATIWAFFVAKLLIFSHFTMKLFIVAFGLDESSATMISGSFTTVLLFSIVFGSTIINWAFGAHK